MNQKLIIIGAGFGGIALAKALRKEPYDVLLLDKNNYHTFQPLLYQVATGGLEADNVAYPIRRIFRKTDNVRFQMCEVSEMKPEAKQLVTSVGVLDYDILVIASGSSNNFFHFESIKTEFLPLKSVTDALDMRSFLMQNLEKAIYTYTHSERETLMNIAIIGGGPAGIELAGALAEMRKYVLPKDFPEIDFSLMTITLFEAGPKLLAAMSPQASKKSLKYLEKLGVSVKLNAKVLAYENQKISLEVGEGFKTDTVIWTAGVKGNSPKGLNEAVYTNSKRIKVDAYNQLEGEQDIFVIGDVALQTTEKYPQGLPMLAPVAIQQANWLAKNLQRSFHGQPMKPFKYKNKGVMATIGKNKAVVDMPNYHFQGAFAWFVWMFVHIISLVGFRNKIVTLIDWSENYFNYDRPLGLIIRPFKKGKS